MYYYYYFFFILAQLSLLSAISQKLQPRFANHDAAFQEPDVGHTPNGKLAFAKGSWVRI